ncbi:hypothetical protein BI334_05905 [Moorena producens 3L]|nr:hypothetical protein BI334_32195 [Moorena producens 3L]OLT64623.1 hypothetical protein BI334_05905 [Moorena producens 3L]
MYSLPFYRSYRLGFFLGNRESGIGNRESGIGNRESGIGNRESGNKIVWLLPDRVSNYNGVVVN